ncbi:MAG: PAS domain-containing protein [Sneathiellaceae bacterium]
MADPALPGGRPALALVAGCGLAGLLGAAAIAWLVPQGWAAAVAVLAVALAALLAGALALHRRQQRSIRELRQVLADERQKLKDFIEASGEIFWETDKDYRLTYIAGKAADLQPGQPYRAMGLQPWTVALDRDDHAKWDRFRALIAARRPFSGQRYTLMTEVGPAVRQVTGMPRYDREGRYAGYRGISVERTVQHRQDEDLRLYRQVVENCIDGIVLTGPPEQDCPIEYVNPAFERLTGFSRAEAVGRNCRFLQGTYDDQPALRDMADALRDGRAIQVEVLNQRRDGSQLHLHLSLSPVTDAAGRIQHYVGIQRDLTPQYLAAEDQRIMAERLSLAVRATGIGIYDIDTRTGRITWDETMERLYGIPRGSFGGNFPAWQKLLHPDDLQAHAEATRDAIREKRGLVTRTRIVRPDGNVRVLQFRTAVVSEEDGTPTRLIGVNRDVTEEHQAQENLRALSRRLSLATEAAGIGIFDLDLASLTVQFDRQMENHYGFAPGQFDGRLRTWRRYIDPDDIARIDADFLAHRHSSEPHSTVLRIRRTDGSRRILREHAVILHDPAGEPVRIIGVNWDITAETDNQARLERLTRRLTLTTRTAGIGFFDWEEGSGTGNWDETLRVLHGIGPGTPGNLETWLGLMEPEERQRAEQFVADRFRTREPGVLDYRLCRADGTIRHLQFHVAPDTDDTGRVVRLLGVAWDVTEEREAELQLRRARDSARAANEAKDRFLATMSHELRTPLNAILGFSEVIREEAVGPLGNPSYREYAQDIHSSGVHLLSLVNDLIDIARVQNAAVRLSEDRLSLDDLLHRLPALLGDNGFARDFPEPLSQAVICGDPRLLAQVLVNLISNARKHAGPTTPVHLGAGRLPSGALSLWVTDQGPGIAAQDQSLVMEPFGRMARTEDAAIPGVGLGLPIARSYVHAHGGQLFLHSAPGLGTTVGLILPAGRLIWPSGTGGPAALPRIAEDWPAGPCMGCLQHEAAGIVRGSDSAGLVLEHAGRCSVTGAEGDACAHWGEQILRKLGGIGALSDPAQPSQAFATCRLMADGAETECLVEVRRGARTPCRAFVTPVLGGTGGPAEA